MIKLIRKMEDKKIEDNSNETLIESISYISDTFKSSNKNQDTHIKSVSNLSNSFLPIKENKSGIYAIKNVPKKVIIKVESSSYIIATIQSLSQILPFANYFIYKEINIFNNICFSLSYELKNFFCHIWGYEEKTFSPKSFMEQMIKIGNKGDKYYFSLKEEKDPFYFLEYLLIIGLNNEDKELNNNKLIKELFFGVLNNSKVCHSCITELNEEQENFLAIDIKYEELSKYLQEKGISLISFDIDICLDFFFNHQNAKCLSCNSLVELKRKIYQCPNVLIIRFDWGKFDCRKGYEIQSNPLLKEEDYSEIDISKYVYNIKETMMIKYRLRTNICYPVKSLLSEHSSQRFFSLCKSTIDNKIYLYRCGKKVHSIKKFVSEKIIPTLFFYEKIYS